MAGRALTIDINTRDQQTLAALRRIERELKSVDGQVRRTRSSGLGLGSALGGIAIGAGISHAIGEFEEAEKGARATAAAIKSTGNAANVSAKDQEALASKLSDLAAVDDELVSHNLNVLRTFTDIKNSGPDKIFDQAALAAMNLAATMEGDLQGATVQVGKALQDPIKGITALSRAGVSFSESQKEMIRSLVESGDKLGAQKVILKELETQFGGQAEAAATDSARMRVAFDNAAESIGQSLAPAFTVLAKGVQGAASAFGALPSGVQAGLVALGGVAVVANKVQDSLDGVNLNMRTTVREAGRLNSGLAAGAAGLASFGATLSALEGATKFHGDLAALGKDVAQLGEGVAGADVIFEHFGGGAEEFAQKFRDADASVADSAKGLVDSIATFGGQVDLPGDIAGTEEIAQAQSDIEALDAAFADLAGSNPAAAREAMAAFTNAMAAQGVTVDDTSGFFPKYIAEIERAERAERAAKDGTKEHTAVLKDNAGALEAVSDAAGAKQRADAERLAKADEVLSAEQAVADATQATADATREAAEAHQAATGNSDEYRDATQAIADAQRAQADAARNTRDAQEDLADAYESARENLEDLQFAAEGAALSEREARLRLKEAREDQRKLKPNASADDRERAAIAVERAELALREAIDRRGDSTRELNEAEAKGVEGSDAVVAAKDRVAEALRGQEDAQRRVGEASERAADIITEAKDREQQALKDLDKARLTELQRQRDRNALVGSGKVATDSYIWSLAALKNTLDPSNPLRRYLEEFLSLVVGSPSTTSPGASVSVGGVTVGGGSTVGAGAPGVGGRPRLRGGNLRAGNSVIVEGDLILGGPYGTAQLDAAMARRDAQDARDVLAGAA